MKLKFFKRLIACAAAFTAIFCCALFCATSKINYPSYADTENAGIDIGKEKLAVKNSKIVDGDGNEFIIHGVCIGDTNDDTIYWGKCTKTTFKLLREEGFNTVRYTFSASLFYSFESDSFKEENLELFDLIAQNAEEAGIYVIIDLHLLRNMEYSFYSYSDDYCLIGESNPDSATAAAKAQGYKEGIYALWEEIAGRLAGNASVLAYSLINEPYGGVDGSQMNFPEYDDYVKDHPTTSWSDYLSIKAETVAAAQKKAIENISGDYTNFIQTLIDKIRARDGETTICFQHLAALCDVSENYKFASFDDYGWTDADKWPDVTAANVLTDCGHLYDNCLFEYKHGDTSVGVLNMSSAENVTQTGWWFSDEYQTLSSDTGNVTATHTTVFSDEQMTNDKKVQSILLNWGALYIRNNGDSAITLTVNSFSIYKEIDGTDTKIFSASESDDKVKLKAYGMINYKEDGGFIGYPVTIAAGDGGNIGGSGIQALKLGVRAGEKVTLEFEVTASTTDGSALDASFNFQCGRTCIGKNKDGQDIITGEDPITKIFTEAKTAADKYDSPIYFAEFCVMSQYINDYTNYKDYTDCFVKYLKEFNAGWVWHNMSEQTSKWVPNDNGYGAYLSTFIPYAKYKNVGFDYVIPQILSTPSVILNEEKTTDAPTEKPEKEGGENGVSPIAIYAIIAASGVIVGAAGALIIYVAVTKKRK